MSTSVNVLHPTHESVSGLVSVVIPAFNAAAYIEETLHSLLQQSYQPLEIIVVDDGSTDETAAIVEKFADRVQLLRQANSGGCSAPRNHGLRAARGEFIAFFDADDLMAPDRLLQQVSFLQQHPQCELVLMDYRNFDAWGDMPQTHFATCPLLRAELQRRDAGEIVLDAVTATRILAVENYAIAGSPLIRRSVFTTEAGFDETLRASEDFELIYRLARRNGLGLIDQPGFRRRLHDDNMSKRTHHILSYKIASRNQLLRDEPNRLHRRLLREALAQFHLSMAEHLCRSQSGQALRHVLAGLRYGHPCNAWLLKTVLKSALTSVGIQPPSVASPATPSEARQPVHALIDAAMPSAIAVTRAANDPIDRRTRNRPWQTETPVTEAAAQDTVDSTGRRAGETTP